MANPAQLPDSHGELSTAMMIKCTIQLGIHIWEQRPLPKSLSDYVERLTTAFDDQTLLVDSEVDTIRNRGSGIWTNSKQDSIFRLESFLFPEPAGQGWGRYIRHAIQSQFCAERLPWSFSEQDQSLCLPAPQPDLCYGYMPESSAAYDGYMPESAVAFDTGASPFDMDEEVILSKFLLSTELHFPFLTARWKAPVDGEGHPQAIVEAALDGAAVVNYLDIFYSKARPGKTPTQLETCHFSVTVDNMSVILWIHWKGQSDEGVPKFYMEQVISTMLNHGCGLFQYLTILRNWVTYAETERLATLKKLVPALGKNL